MRPAENKCVDQMFSEYLQWWDRHPWVAVIIIVVAFSVAILTERFRR